MLTTDARPRYPRGLRRFQEVALEQDIAGWLIILADATAKHDIDEITEARAELDRLLRQPVTTA